jgi:hypothetical protein
MVRALSFHAEYGCRHRGACCTAGWPIDVEPDRAAAIDLAWRAGRILAGRPLPLVEGHPTRLALSPDGTCACHDARAARCEMHRALGHSALPLACRQFPRVSLTDPRGVSVTLSHFCPTAAALLATRGTVSIVQDAPAFPAGGEYVGLDAREGLPPLLRPDCAMDWTSWWELERHAVAAFDRATDDPDRGLAGLAGAVASIRTWRVGDGDLSEHVRRAFASAPAGSDPDLTPADARRVALSAIPAALRPAALPDGHDTPVGERARFLAAHAFANWIAHLGQDLTTWVRSIALASALLESGLDVRHADLLLRHLADPDALALQLAA